VTDLRLQSELSGGKGECSGFSELDTNKKRKKEGQEKKKGVMGGWGLKDDCKVGKY